MQHLLKILVLDDDRDSADMLSSLLGSYFPEAIIKVAYTAEDAIAVGKKFRPHVAVLDLEIGSSVGGERVALDLRAALFEARPSVIALSGDALRLSALQETGHFDHLLSKPVDIDSLVALIQRRVNDF